MGNTQLHRFRNKVAISLPSAPGADGTAYLSADEAERLAGELKRFAADIRDVEFTDSKIAPVEFSIGK